MKPVFAALLLAAFAGGVLAAEPSGPAPGAATGAGAAAAPAGSDYGSFPSNHEAIVKAYYGKKKPATAIRKITAPKQFFLGNAFEGTQFGYLVCATVTAKSAADPAGKTRTDGFLIRNGEVVEFLENGVYWGGRFC